MTSSTRVFRFTALVSLVFVAMALAAPREASAIDKRLKLAFKTAGYGAGAGLVIGAGTVALGMGGFRNVLMGASTGMYAGLLLAGYIIATPPDHDDDDRRQGPRNPYRPRKPVGPDDYEEGEDGLEQHLPPKRDDSDSQYRPPGPLDDPALELGRGRGRSAEIALWAPVVSLSF